MTYLQKYILQLFLQPIQEYHIYTTAEKNKIRIKQD